MFKRLFKKQNLNNLSKLDYSKKWELFELFDNLDNAKELLISAANETTNKDLSEFKNAYIEELDELEHANIPDFTRIWQWFSPSKEWDTFVGEGGKNFRDNIFRITDNWKRDQAC